MEDLYPGKATGTGFRVYGFARTYDTTTPPSRPEHVGQVVAGFYAFLNRPTPEDYRQASYEVALDIPWAVLRFMFYDAMHLVVENHRLYGLPEEGR